MNYAQEQYIEARKMIYYETGIELPDKKIDRILSIFATVPQLTREQWKEAWKIYRCENDLRGAINTFLAKQGPVVAAKPADGMVSLEDVRKAFEPVHVGSTEWKKHVPYDRCGMCVASAAEISEILSDRLSRLTKPEPTVTLVDAAEGRTFEVPASAVHEMDYPEAVVTYRHWEIEGTNVSICNRCGSIVYDEATHSAYHRKEVGK